MYIGYDFEFLEKPYSLRPISIGLRREDGEGFYAVYSDMPQQEVWGHEWLRQHVVPQLPCVADPRIGGFLDVTHPDVLPAGVIAEEVRHFINSTNDPMFVGNCDAHDYALLRWLFGTFASPRQPGKLRYWTIDIQQWAWHLGINDSAFPKQSDTEHHALHDAEWNLETMLWLDGVATARGLRPEYAACKSVFA